MMTIQQLLKLARNPYYQLTEEDKVRLDDFLSKKRAKDSQSSQNKNSKKSSGITRVRVKNIVEKTDTDPLEVNNSAF